MLKKLDISNEEWQNILNAPNKTEDYYKNDKKLTDFCFRVKNQLFGTKNWV